MIESPVYDEGYQARINDQPRTANPYKADNPSHDIWDQGWVESDSFEKSVSN